MRTLSVSHLFTLYTLAASQEAVELQSVNHAQAGPTPDSFVYIEGQNMIFVCNATPSNEALFWVVELTGQMTGGGALVLAISQPRIETEVTSNLVNPSNITILNAMLEDSNTTVTCKDANVGNIVDVLTIHIEGLPPCPRVTLNGTTDSTISLSWVPTGLLSTLQYQITTDPAIDGVKGAENVTSYTFTGLQPLTQYNISIAACNVVGCSSNCGVVYTTGPMWEDDFVSVCSNGGSNPADTVFVQYMSDMNSSASEFVVSISGQSRTKRVPITGDGEYSAYFDGVTLGNMYTVTVQPFNGSSAGKIVTRQITVQAAVSVLTGTNHTFSCRETCVGPLSVSSCQTTVTCGTNSTYYLTTSVGSTNSTSVPDCATCTASTVVQLDAGQQNFTQTDSLSVIGSICEGSFKDATNKGDNIIAISLSVSCGSLIFISLFSVVLVLVIIRHCYKNTSKRNSHSMAETIYCDPLEREKKIQADVAMTDNPAYGPIEATLVKDIVTMQGNANEQDTGLVIYEDPDMTTNPAYSTTSYNT